MRSKDDFMKIADIAKRADEAGLLMFDRMSLILDLEAVHNEVGLKLEELLNADDANFTHDIAGIQKHIDRQTKKLTDCFLPRYAK